MNEPIIELPYLVLNNSVTVFNGNQIVSVIEGQTNYIPLLKALKEKDFIKAVQLLDIRNEILIFFEGKIEIKGGTLYYLNEPIHNTIVTRILSHIENSLPYENLVNFLYKLLQNPSYNSRQQLYRFLEAGKLPIFPDGCFLAYKGIRMDYYSVQANSNCKVVSTLGEVNVDLEKAGHVYNGIGTYVSMNRGEINDNPNVACSVGLHAGSFDYAKGHGKRIVAVKIDPANAVSVPIDHYSKKLRTSAYEVLYDCTEQVTSLTVK